MTHQFIRNIKLGNTALEASTFDAFTKIELDFFWEAVEIVKEKNEEEKEEEYKEVGKQLLQAIWQSRQKAE